MIGPEVMLAVPGKGPPEQLLADLMRTGRWWTELKLDGIRAVVQRAGDGSVRITNRRRVDITYRYPDVVAAVQSRPFVGTLDGEIIVAGVDGQPDFSLAHRRDAQQTVGNARRLAAQFPATFVPFDILEDDGTDLRTAAYVFRRQHLLSSWGEKGVSFASQDGLTMWAFVRERGMEGLVAKLGEARYYPGRRHPSWVKLRSTLRVSALVTGFVPGKGSRGDIGALHLALWDPELRALRPIGRVGSGMREADMVEVSRVLDAGGPLVVEVEYLEVAPSGQLRMPVFRGIRTDIAPEACTVETLA